MRTFLLEKLDELCLHELAKFWSKPAMIECTRGEFAARLAWWRIMVYGNAISEDGYASGSQGTNIQRLFPPSMFCEYDIIYRVVGAHLVMDVAFFYILRDGYSHTLFESIAPIIQISTCPLRRLSKCVERNFRILSRHTHYHGSARA